MHVHGGDGRTTRSLRAAKLAIVVVLLAISATPRERQESPPRAARPGFVYDPVRRVTVLFGGEGADGRTLGDTWEYDGVAWRRASERGPSPRAGFGIAYDGARGRTVIHGGFIDGSAAPRTDTWVWDGSTWTRVAVAGPSGTTFHRMVYDAHRQRVVAFGGRGGGGETWEWDGRSWTKAAQRPLGVGR